MNEYRLLIGLGVLFILALIAVLYPLRHHQWRLFWITPFLMIFLGCAYWQWGAWPAWQTYQQQLVQQQRAQALLSTTGGPQKLITQLRTHLQTDPNSARGWYLLGRLYAGQNQWHLAKQAFSKAYQLQPADEQTTVNYVQSLIEDNQGQMPSLGRKLLHAVLQHNSQQPDALALLAMDAYSHQSYAEAINYWQRLLALVPTQSEAGQALRKAIGKAQMKLRALHA